MKELTQYAELPIFTNVLPTEHLAYYYPDLQGGGYRKLILAEPGVLFANVTASRAELTVKVHSVGPNPMGKMSYPEVIALMYNAAGMLNGLNVLDPAWSHFRKEYTDAVRIADAFTALHAIPFVDHYRKCKFVWSNDRNECGEAEIYVPRHYNKNELVSVLQPTVHLAFTQQYPDDPEIRRGLQVEILDLVDVTHQQ